MSTTARRHAELAMGTVFSFAVEAAAHPGPPADLDAGLRDAVAWLHEVDDRFTTFRESAWLRFARGELAPDDAHPDVRLVANRCAGLADETHGDFSLTADPSRPADPAAYVKGWATQRAAELVAAAGAGAVLVNGGGDIAVTRRDRPWRLGVQHPTERDRLLGTVELEHGGMATSGSYERGHHVFDPATGAPATTFASVTVVGPDLGDADAYATAAFAAGWRCLDWLDGLDGYGAWLVGTDGRTEVVGDLRVDGPVAGHVPL